MSSTHQTKISIIIPCRNEERYIGKCLDSIVACDFSKDRLEVFVVDGASTDNSKAIINDYCQRYAYIQLLDNPRKIIPTAMNAGIQASTGDVIMKIDSHSSYSPDYISTCVQYLYEYSADNVGGVVQAIPRNNTAIGRAIAYAISHPFGVGNSLFRIGAKAPMWADTAFSGCYRRSVFDRIGLYDENIARSEDVTINRRLLATGGKILLVPHLITTYFTRSTLRDFITHNIDNGKWITFPLYYKVRVFSIRHLIPLVFVVSLLGTFILGHLGQGHWWIPFALIAIPYLALAVSFSVIASFKKRSLSLFLPLLLCFPLLHVSYGIGEIYGFILMIWRRAFPSTPA